MAITFALTLATSPFALIKKWALPENHRRRAVHLAVNPYSDQSIRAGDSPEHPHPQDAAHVPEVEQRQVPRGHTGTAGILVYFPDVGAEPCAAVRQSASLY